MTRERWLPVVGFEGVYEVSDAGNVRRIAAARTINPAVLPRTLRQTPTPNGYLTVVLSKDGEATKRTVHSLVLEAFRGPRPEGYYGCHNDGQKENSRLENLRWDTPAANFADAKRHGTWRQWQAGRTHCQRGHEFTEANTMVGGDGRRRCRRCHNARCATNRRRKAGGGNAPQGHIEQ